MTVYPTETNPDALCDFCHKGKKWSESVVRCDTCKNDRREMLRMIQDKFGIPTEMYF